MKKVIDGKTYNTDTAEYIANYDSGHGRGDFSYICEDLYLTKNGRYFVAGEGGANTRYAKSCGNNSWCGGEFIEVLSQSEALAWCENHYVDADVITDHFTIEDG